MNRLVRRCLLVLSLVLMGSLYLHAQTAYTWNAGASGNWSVAANWTPNTGQYPGQVVGDTVTLNTNFTVTIDAGVGAGVTIAGLTESTGSIDLSGRPLTITGTASIGSGGTEITNTGASTTLTFGGAVTLTNNTVLQTAGTITFNSSVGGNAAGRTLTLRATTINVNSTMGSAGTNLGTLIFNTSNLNLSGGANSVYSNNTVTFAGEDGATPPAADGTRTINVVGAGGANLNVSQTSLSAIAATTSLRIGNGGTQTGAITIGNGAVGPTVAVPFRINNNAAGGSTVFSGPLTVTGANQFRLSSRSVTFNYAGGSVVTLGGGNFTTDGTTPSYVLQADTTFAMTGGTFNSGPTVLTINGFTAGSQSLSILGAATTNLPTTTAVGTTTTLNGLTIQSNTISLPTTANNIRLTGTATLQPNTTGTSIGLAGGAGTLSLSQAGINAFANSLSDFVIGYSGGTAQITANAVSFVKPVLIQSNGAGGVVQVNGLITGTGTASVAIQAPTINLNVAGTAVTTANVAITLTGAIVLQQTTTLNSTSGTGADVTLAGTVNANAAGTQGLTITAGTGNVTFSSTLGATNRLAALNVTGGTGGNYIKPTGNIAANSVTLTGPVQLQGTLQIDTSVASGNVGLTSTVDGSAANTQGLTITSGTGTISLGGMVGGTTSLASLFLTSTNAAAAAITIRSVTTGGAGTQSYSGNTTLGAATVLTSNGQNIGFGATLNGAQTLNLIAGAGTVSFGGIVGGGTALSSMTLTSGTLNTGGYNVSVSGALDTSGNTLNLGSGGILTVGGNLTLGTLSNVGGTTIALNGSALQTYTTNGQAIANLTINNSGAGVQLVGNLSQSAASGSLTMTAGTLDLNGNTLTLGNNLTIGNSTIVTLNNGTLAGGTSNITVGQGTLTAGGTSSITNTGNFTVNNAAAVVTVGTGTFTVGAMSVSSGSFTQTGVNGGTNSVASLTVSGGSCTWDSTSLGGTLTITGSLSNSATLSFNNKNVDTGGNVTGNITFLDLVIPTGTTVTPQAASSITVLRHLTIQNGGTYTNNGRPLTLGGGSITIGTITDSNATKQDLGAVSLANGGGATTKTLATPILTTSLVIAANVNLALTGFDLTVGGTISGAGTLTASGTEAITVGGSMTVTTFTAGNSTVTFNGSGAGPYATNGYSFYNLTMNLGAMATQFAPSAGITVTNGFTQTRGTFAGGAALTHTIAGDWNSNNVNVGLSAGTSTVQLSSANPTIVLAGAQSFNNLTLQRGGTLGSDVTIGGDFAVASTSAGTLAGSTFTLHVAGNATMNTGTPASLTANISTLDLNGSGSQTIGTNGVNWYNVTVGTRTAGTVTFNQALNVTNNLTVSGAGGYAVAINNGGTAANAVTFANTGNVTIAAGYAFTGGVTSTNAGTNSLAGTIQTGGAAGQNISLDDLTIPAAGLTLDTGALGTFSVTGVVSAAGNSLTLSNTDGATFGAALNVGTLQLSSTVAAASPVIFNGALTVGTLTPQNGTYDIQLNAGGTATAAASFANIGYLTIASGYTFTGGASKTSGTKNFAGTINGSGAANLDFGTAGTVNITGNATMGGTTGTITLFDVIIADGATLNLGNASSAPIVQLGSVSGVAGGAASNLTIANQGANATITGAVGTDIGTITLTKTGGTAAFNGSVVAAALSPTAGAYALQLNAGGSITAFVNFLNTGNVNINSLGGDDFYFQGGLSSIAAGNNTLVGTVRTNGVAGANINLDDLVIGAAGLTLDTGAAGLIGVSAAVTGGNNLTIADTNGATFSSTVNVGTLTLSATINAASAIVFDGAITAAAMSPNAGTYDLQFNAGATITGLVTFANNGTLRIGNDIADVFTANGGFAATTPSLVSIAGTLVTSNDDILLGNVTLLTDATISSQLAAGAGNITITGILNDSTAATDALTLRAGSGTIDYQGAVSTTALRYIQIGSAAVLTNSLAATIAWDNTPLFVNAPGSTMFLQKDLYLYNLIGYAGTTDLNGREVRVQNDAVLIGASYSTNDPGRGVAGVFAAPASTTSQFLLAVPGSPTGGLANSVAGGRLKVIRNFYANGASLAATQAWGLWLTDKSEIDDLNLGVDNAIGTGAAGLNDYAIALNSSVSNCMVSQWDGVIWTATTGTEYVNAAENCGPVMASPQWITTRPSVRSARTIYDDMVEVYFWDGTTNIAIENSNDEIQRVLNVSATKDLRFNLGANRFLSVWEWSDPAGDNNGIWSANEVGTFVPVPTGDIPAGTRLYFKTNASLATVGAVRWNTDATGSSLGTATSTDRGGTPQTIVPRLILQKARLFAALGKTMNDNVGDDGSGGYVAGTAYNSTADGCQPVLIGVYTGQSAYVAGTAVMHNGHNFVHIRYSEPVNMSGLSGSTIAAGAPVSGGDATLSDYTGPIRSSSALGTFTNAVNGTVSISGLGLSYGSATYYSNARNYVTGLPAQDPAMINLMYRSNDTTTENPVGAQGITIFLAGYAVSGTTYWPGYLGNPNWTTEVITDPGAAGLVMTQAYVAGLVDALGNTIEPSSNSYPGKPAAGIVASNTGAVALGGTMTNGWDVAAPTIQADVGGNDIYPVVSVIGGPVTRLDIKMSKAIRDTSWSFDDGDAPLYTNERAWFLFGNLLGYPTSATFANNNAFSTSVNTVWYGGSISAADDQYFSVAIAGGSGWDSTTTMYLTYTPSGSGLTDLAGNVMRSSSQIVGIDRTPPNIQLALAAVNGSKVYVQFDKPVFQSSGMAGTIAPSNFVVNSAGSGVLTVSSVEVIEQQAVTSGATPIYGTTKAFLVMASPITANQIMDGQIQPSGSAPYDKFDNLLGSISRLSNVGIGLAEPVQGSDDIVNVSMGQDIQTKDLLRDFTSGTGGLSGRGMVNIRAALTGLTGIYQNPATYPLSLYYDAQVSDGYRGAGGNFWNPSTIPGLVSTPETSARSVIGVPLVAAPGNTYFDFSLPGAGISSTKNAKVELILSLGGLPLAWTPDTEDPRKLKPWSFVLGIVPAQKAGVTILNNVINPLASDKAVLQYTVGEAGSVNITVFTIDGKVVKSIQRGRKASGDYFVTWDGRNNSGDVVATSMYLVRVVAPGVDEFRKVLVVKP